MASQRMVALEEYQEAANRIMIIIKVNLEMHRLQPQIATAILEGLQAMNQAVIAIVEAMAE